MKKLLLLSFAVSLCMGASAQNKPTILKSRVVLSGDRLKNAKVVKIDAVDQNLIPFKNTGPLNLLAPAPAAKFSAPNTTVIGRTHYDLQTNAAISNRLVRNADGTLSAAWTTAAAADIAKAFPDRGTGYNYFDGTAWTTPVPASAGTARIESYRMGFTNIAVTASGKELCIGHSSTIGELNVCARPAKGTGAWADYDSLLGVDDLNTWAKVIAGGASGENVYVIVNGSGVGSAGAPAPTVAGQAGPMFYSRSTDGGATFSTLNTVIAGTDSTFYHAFGGDDYSIDSRGDIIAIALGDYNTDLMLLKSTDGGVTFTKTVIVTSPLTQPFDPYNTTTGIFPDLNSDGFSDTLELPSGDAKVMIDNAGNCHVFFTTVFALNGDGTGTGFFPNALDGLFYWNESMGATAPALIANTPDINGNGQIDFPSRALLVSLDSTYDDANGAGSYRGSLLEKPSAGIDATGNIYCSFMGGCEDCDSTTYGVLHKHTFIVTSLDGGSTWSQPYDILKESFSGGSGWEYSETTFGCIARDVDGFVHITYSQDDAPGLALSATTSVLNANQTVTDIVYAKIPTSDLTGIANPASSVKNNLSLSPNPAADYSYMNINIAKSADVTIKVTNTIGQEIYSQSTKNLGAGAQRFKLNTSNYPAGIYFCTVIIGNERITNKLVVN